MMRSGVVEQRNSVVVKYFTVQLTGLPLGDLRALNILSMPGPCLALMAVSSLVLSASVAVASFQQMGMVPIGF